MSDTVNRDGRATRNARWEGWSIHAGRAGNRAGAAGINFHGDSMRGTVNRDGRAGIDKIFNHRMELTLLQGGDLSG